MGLTDRRIERRMSYNKRPKGLPYIDYLTGMLTAIPRIFLVGAVLDPAIRRCLAGRGFVVYLCATVDEQLRRTRHDTNRPLLQTDDPRARLAQLFEQRDPLYREIADLIVASDGHSVRTITQRILEPLAPDAASR